MAANPIVLGIPAPLARPRGRADAGLSIVVPVYNEAGNLPGLHARIVEVATALHKSKRLVTEVIYVDDGSRDDTLAVARRPAVGARFLCHHQLGRAPQDSGGCRRLQAALSARRRRAASAPRAQPLLQGSRQLDRLPATARRL